MRPALCRCLLLLALCLVASCAPQPAPGLRGTVSETDPESTAKDCLIPFGQLQTARDHLVSRNSVNIVFRGGRVIMRGGSTAAFRFDQIRYEQDLAKRLKLYMGEVQTDLSNSTMVRFQALETSLCLVKQFDDALQRYQDRRLSKEEFIRIAENIKKMLVETNDILIEAKLYMDRNDAAFRKALVQDPANTAGEALLPSTTKPAEPVPAPEKPQSSKKTQSKDALRKMQESIRMERNTVRSRVILQIAQADPQPVPQPVPNSLEELCRDHGNSYARAVEEMEEQRKTNDKVLNIISDFIEQAGLDIVYDVLRLYALRTAPCR